MYLSTGGIKLICTLSFIFKGSYGISLKAKHKNRQYFFLFYPKEKINF